MPEPIQPPQPWKKIARRVSRESAIPATFAIAFGIYAWLSKGSVFDGVSFGGVVFMFSLSLQGQFLRVIRNVKDDERSEEYLGHFASLREGIADLRARAVHRVIDDLPADDGKTIQAPIPSTSRPRPIGFGVEPPSRPPHFAPDWARDFDAANFALEGQEPRMAVVMAALGFEKALEEAAGPRLVATKPQRAVPRRVLIDTLPLDDDQRGTIQALIRMRNSVVHSVGEPPSLEQAEELVRAFRHAADMVTYKLPVLG